MTSILSLASDHLSQCVKLYIEIFSHAPWNEAWDEKSAQQRLLETFNTPGFVGIGYFENNGLVAFILGNSESWLNMKQFYLKEMCVKTELQGKGVGKVLLSQLKQRLLEQQIQKIYLLTMHNSNAYHFYNKNDFITSEKMIVMGCNIS